MAHGRKTGGRQAGTPNRRTLDIQQRLTTLGCDPIAGMACIAMDTNNPIEIRARMYAELAGYVAPKRKAVEIEGNGVNPVIFNVGIAPRLVGSSELKTMGRALDYSKAVSHQ